jgi:diguanylate cyclase (GGDEF)-like protein
MRRSGNYAIRGLIIWWLTRKLVFRELMTWIVSFLFGLVFFGLTDMLIGVITQETITRFALWTTMGFIFSHIPIAIISTMTKEYAILEKRVVRDSLTGLYNHEFLEEAIKLTISQSRRNMQYFAVYVIDLNKFKSINDTFGHEAGNLALKKFSQVIQETIYRRNDIIIRYGGDEFVILCTTKEPVTIFERLSKKFNGDGIPFHFGSKTIYLTASIGYASTKLEKNIPSDTPEEEIYRYLFHEADMMMYEIKKTKEDAPIKTEG